MSEKRPTIPVFLKSVQAPVAEEITEVSLGTDRECWVRVWVCNEKRWLKYDRASKMPEIVIPEDVHGQCIVCLMDWVEERELEEIDEIPEPHDNLDIKQQLQNTLQEYESLRHIEDPRRFEQERMEILEERIRVYTDELYIQNEI